MKNDPTPVADSKITKGSAVKPNAARTAFRPAAPFQGRFLDDYAPAIARTAAKTPAMSGFQFVSLEGGGAPTVTEIAWSASRLSTRSLERYAIVWSPADRTNGPAYGVQAPPSTASCGAIGSSTAAGLK